MAELPILGRPLIREERGFAALHAQHGALVRRLLRFFGVRPRDVDDVAQNVWLAAYRSFDPERSESGWRAWLRTVCYRETIDFYRRRSMRDEIPALYDDDAPGVPSQNDCYDRFEHRQLVKRVLKRMSPKLKVVLIRSVLGGENLDRIGEKLGISVNTAQRRLAKAKESFEYHEAEVLRENRPPRRRLFALLPFGLGALFRVGEASAHTAELAPLPASSPPAPPDSVPPPSSSRPVFAVTTSWIRRIVGNLRTRICPSAMAAGILGLLAVGLVIPWHAPPRTEGQHDKRAVVLDGEEVSLRPIASDAQNPTLPVRTAELPIIAPLHTAATPVRPSPERATSGETRQRAAQRPAGRTPEKLSAGIQREPVPRESQAVKR